jgi:acetyl-CoA carboxylase biotin carboxyl carrier protein
LNNDKKPPQKPKTPAVDPNTSPMDVSLLESIVKLMQANDLNTVDLRDGERRVVMKRGPKKAALAGQLAVMPAAAGKSAAEGSGPVPGDEFAGFVKIKSPMVGTYYSAASPDAKPFVSVGSTVSEDTDVCVIEAMKVFNNVKAECHGTIAKINVENGQAVEFGQVLFLVKP